MPGNDRGRPREKATPADNLNSDASLAAAERYAVHALRIAWLRGNAHLLFEAESETAAHLGLLAVQLLDFGDVLESDARGWVQ